MYLKSADDICDAVGARSVVSFDVFDTVLVRLASPKATIRAAVRRLGRALDRAELPIDDQLLLRHRLDYHSRYGGRQRGVEREFLVDEWLGAAARHFKVDADTFVEIGLHAELETERQLTMPRPGLEAVLERLRKSGKRLVAISDTYLSSASLSQLLVEGGFEFDAVFSSGELKLSKRRGTIFGSIERELNCVGDEIFHVGDSLKSDLVRPNLAGWAGCFLAPPKSVLNLDTSNLAAEPLIRQQVSEIRTAFRGATSVTDQTALFRLGYDVIAPLLIVFSIFQWRRFIEHDVQVAYYLARDAWMMFDVYDSLAEFFPNSPERHYLRLSRRAITLAHPENLLRGDADLVGRVGHRNVGEYLGQFDLGEALSESLLDHASLTLETPFSADSRRALVAALNEFSGETEARAVEQKVMLRDLLLQMTEQRPLSRIALVDTGWAGSTQDAIRASLPDAEIVCGVYLGVSRRRKPLPQGNLKYGLLRDDHRELRHSNVLEKTAGVVRLWEMLLGEHAQTVRSITRAEDGSINVVYLPAQQWSVAHEAGHDELRSGLEMFLSVNRRGIAALFELAPEWSDEVLGAAASSLSRRATITPPSAVARQLLAFEMEEGLAPGRSTSLGLAGLRSGVAWYTGILSAYGLSSLVRPLERVAERFLKKGEA